MNLAAQIGLIASLVGTSVALLTWAVTLVSARVDARRELRRELVTRVIEIISAVVKQRTQPVLVTSWQRKEVDLLLLQPRLALDLGRRDSVVALWVWAQTQRLLDATDEAEVTSRAIRIGSSLALWHRGDLKRKWFTAELREEPIIDDFAISRAARGRRSKRNFKEVAAGGTILALVVVLIKQASTLFD